VITGATQLAAVIGSPVRHSRSPAIHNAGFAAAGLDWVYVALEVAPGRGADAVHAASALGLRGLSVTMPHKADAAAACDELTPAAAALASVNTVVVRDDGTLLGDSTDGEGFLRSLADAGLDPAGRSVLLLGAGGAARAVAAALVGRGATVEVAARRAEAGDALAAAVRGVRAVEWPSVGVAAAEIVVNATPIGMGDDPNLPVEPAPDQWVVDLVYHPLETPLLRRARAVGASTVGGLGMLVHQAALAFEQWTGVPAPLDAMRAAATTEPD
jgi:shikimate dehydrogenase